jgi:hypothetical protein
MSSLPEDEQDITVKEVKGKSNVTEDRSSR